MENKWICKRCGNEQYVKPKKNEICNHNGCKGRFRRHSKCNCGKWFLNIHDQKYCSNTCKSEEHIKILKCHQCGRVFKRYTSNIKGEMNFCNIQCMREYEKTLHEDRVCLTCGKTFSVISSTIRSSNAEGKYCCKECYNKSLEKEGCKGYRADFGRLKKRYFKGVQFCAICGTTSKIHIHHIIPFKMTQDNRKKNLIPLCSKHHVQIERMCKDFIECMDDKETALDMLNSILRTRQLATWGVIKGIYEKRRDAKY